MNYQSYCESKTNILNNDSDKVLEEVDIVGYSIVEDVLSLKKVEIFKQVLDEAWKKQIKETGEEKLKSLNEWGTVRALIFYNQMFSELIRHRLVMEVISKTVGETAILHLINGTISFPNYSYHQANLHRDFAKGFVSNKMLSINVFWILDSFTEKTGGTWFVPHTHKIEYKPSDEFVKKHEVQLIVPSGSLVFFDSRIYHKAGNNTSSYPRRAINLQYTKPFIKQQINLPELMDGLIDRESPLGQTLGMWSVSPCSVKEFRVDPHKRTYKPGQG